MAKIKEIKMYDNESVDNRESYALITYIKDNGNEYVIKTSLENATVKLNEVIKENGYKNIDDILDIVAIYKYDEASNASELLDKKDIKEEYNNFFETVIKRNVKDIEIKEVEYNYNEKIGNFTTNLKYKVTYEDGKTLTYIDKDLPITYTGDELQKYFNDNSVEKYNGPEEKEMELKEIMKNLSYEIEKENKDNIDRDDMIMSIDYYRDGDKFEVEVLYTDGNIEKIDLREANNLISRLIDKGIFDSEFRKHNLKFHKYADNSMYEIDYDEFKNDTGILDIEKIVMNKNGKEGTVIYKNGKAEDYSASEIDNIFNKYKDLTGKNELDLVEDGFLSEMNDEEIEDYIDEMDEITEKDENKDNILSNIKITTKKFISKLKKSPVFIKVASVALAVGLIITGCTIAKKLSSKEITEDTNAITTDEQTTGNVEEKDYSIYTLDQLLEMSKNTTRNDVMKKTKSYINKHYIKGIENRDADIDVEVDAEDYIAMYVAYNSLTQDEVDAIYGKNKTMNVKSIISSLKSIAINDKKDHSMQKHSLGKDILLNDQEAKQFYLKYEKMFININKTENNDEKKQLLKDFYTEVRKDLPTISSDNYDGVEAYKYIVKEFVLAAKTYDIDLANEITPSEEEYIDGILDNVIEPKLQGLVDSHNKIYDDNYIDEDPTYQVFVDKLMEDYQDKFDKLYIPDEDEEEKIEENKEEKSNKATTKSMRSNTVGNTNNNIGNSGYQENATTNENEEEVEDVYDEGYNNQKDEKDNKKKKKEDIKEPKEDNSKQKPEDVNIPEDSNNNEKPEDVNIPEDSNDNEKPEDVTIPEDSNKGIDVVPAEDVDVVVDVPIQKSNTNIEDVKVEEHELTKEEIADIAVEIMANEEVEDINASDYQYSK